MRDATAGFALAWRFCLARRELCLLLLRLLRNDGDEKRVAIGVRELMSIQVSAMLDGLVQLKPVVLHGTEVIHVLHYNAFPVSSRLALQFHVGLLSVG